MPQLQRVITAYFSPTGGTKKVAMALQEGFLDFAATLEHAPEVVSYNFLTPQRRSNFVPTFTASDLLVFVYPVFFGRMPWAYEQWPELKGNGASAIVVSVYGNRAIEDGERETMAFLTQHGFKVCGKIEAIAEHSQERTLAAGRPDTADHQELKECAARIGRILTGGTKGMDALGAFKFDDTTPLKAPGKAPSVPSVQDRSVCDDCARCVHICPCNIIDRDTLEVPPEKAERCMGCRACMHVCRPGCRGFTPQVYAAIAERMGKVKAANSERKPIVMALSQPALKLSF